jgi:hypothetical protein
MRWRFRIRLTSGSSRRLTGSPPARPNRLQATSTGTSSDAARLAVVKHLAASPRSFGSCSDPILYGRGGAA